MGMDVTDLSGQFFEVVRAIFRPLVNLVDRVVKMCGYFCESILESIQRRRVHDCGDQDPCIDPQLDRRWMRARVRLPDVGSVVVDVIVRGEVSEEWLYGCLYDYLSPHFKKDLLREMVAAVVTSEVATFPSRKDLILGEIGSVYAYSANCRAFHEGLQADRRLIDLSERDVAKIGFIPGKSWMYGTPLGMYESFGSDRMYDAKGHPIEEPESWRLLPMFGRAEGCHG